MRITFLLTALVPLAWSLSTAAGEPAHHWSYEGESGPSHWGGTCQAGKVQSPIDIAAAKATRVKLPALAFDYRPGALHIVDNGHSIQVRVAGGSTLSVGGAHFTLVQFHFHKPSEEAFDGKRFAMVVHLVHQDAAGHLAVVAVPLTAGRDNPVIASLWKHVPAEKGKEASPAGVTVDPSGLLPANHAYFTFPGSLTTPPCSEGVRWFVLRSPTAISSAEVAAFGKRYTANARPLQPLNRRKVLASQ